MGELHISNLQIVLTNAVCVNEDSLLSMLHTIAKKANLTTLKQISHSFKPHGFTGVLLLSESHLSVHTWPEHETMYFDLSSCKPISKETQTQIASLLQNSFPNCTITMKETYVI